MVKTKDIYNKIAIRLTERFAFKKRDSKIIAKEVLLALHEIIAESDEVQIPHLGRFRIHNTLVNNLKRYSVKLKKYITGPAYKFSVNFKPAAELKIKMRHRKFGYISNVQNLEKENDPTVGQ